MNVNQNWPINLGKYMRPSDQRRGGGCLKRYWGEGGRGGGEGLHMTAYV